MKIGQKVKVINPKLSHFGEIGIIINKLTTMVGNMIEVKFPDGLKGAFRKENLRIQNEVR